MVDVEKVKPQDKVDEALGRLEHRQKIVVESIIDDCIEDDGFVFPVVDGPPGTGKTLVGGVAAAKYLLENPNGQVLYTAYTNFAVKQAKETLEQKLGFSPEDVVRLTPGVEKDWKRGVVGVLPGLSNLGINDIRRLRAAPVILCTLYTSSRIKSGRLRGAGTKVLVDEFSQVDPASFFMLVNNIRTINPGGYVLLGDPLQLPVVTTQDILEENIGSYVISRHRYSYEPHRLVLQHRMHKEICNAVNRMREELSIDTPPEMKSSEDAKDRDLEKLGYTWNKGKVADETIRDILDPSKPFVLVNTDKLDGKDEQNPRTGSWMYANEAKLAVEIARVACDVYERRDERISPQDVALLSPYNTQVCKMSELLQGKPLESSVLTVYKSQGREYPLVIVSLTRKNPECNLGFLDDAKLRAQVYVACSRAKGKLVVLMSKSTFSSYPLYEALIDTETDKALKVWWD